MTLFLDHNRYYRLPWNLPDNAISWLEVTKACTSCDPERFFSHRRDRGRTGRQGVMAYVA